MKQFTLDNWLNIKTTNYKIKKYFYLNWESQFLPNNAIWLHKKPNKVNFIEPVKWKKISKDFEFYICGYFPDINSKYSIIKEKKYKNIHYLKSHLQKAIRRKEDTLAVKTAYHMIKNDIVSFLRRLPIITIEDVMLIESFSTLIWIMVACSSTKFKIKKYIVEWLLGYVCSISLLDKKDQLKKIDIIENNLNIKLDSYNKYENKYSNLLYSLHLRKAYGGMKSDIKLIDKHIINWEERFNKNKIDKNFYIEINPISFSMENLSLDNWILSAIDFHCYPKILKILKKRFPEFTENELKKLIWCNCSSVNARVINEDYNFSSFLKIKDDLNNLQKYLLHCYY